MRNTATRPRQKSESTNNRDRKPELTEKQRESGYRQADIRVGVCPTRVGHLQQHVDGRLTRPQAEAMKRLRQWLDETGHRTANGHKVQSLVDVVRWLAEQLAAEIDHKFVPYTEDADVQVDA